MTFISPFDSPFLNHSPPLRLSIDNRLINAAVALLLFFACSAQANERRSRAWEQAHAQEWKLALPLFRELAASKEATRKDRFGLALALLFQQPRTKNVLDKADQLFTKLTDEFSDDPIGIASQYYRIRIGHVFSLNPDLDASRLAYRDLYRKYSDDFFGQQALVRYAILTTFASQPIGDLKADLPEIEAIAPRLSEPSSRRDAALALAQAYLVLFRDKRSALKWYNVADEAGITRRADSKRSYLSAAGAAWDLQEWDKARYFYNKFLSLNTRDNREVVVRKRLHAIDRAMAGETIDFHEIP